MENDPKMNGSIDEDQDTQGKHSKFKQMLKFSTHVLADFDYHEIHSKNEGQSHLQLTIKLFEIWIVFRFFLIISRLYSMCKGG